MALIASYGAPAGYHWVVALIGSYGAPAGYHWVVALIDHMVHLQGTIG